MSTALLEREARDWTMVELGEVLEVQNGFAFSSKKFSETEGFPLIRIRDLKNNGATAVKFSGEYDQSYVVNAGDLLIGMDGEFLCYEYGGDPALLNQRVCRLTKFSDRLDPRFVFYGINKFLNEIEAVTSFTTVKHLSSKKIKSIQFPLPPLEEQKRIVAMLDKTFAALDRARALAEANLADAEELLKASRKNLLRSCDFGGAWTEKPLGEVCVLQRGFDLPKPQRKVGKYPLVTSSGITDSHTEAKVKGPGVTTGRSGSIGHVFYVEDDFWPLNTALYIKDFHGNEPKYIYHLLKEFDLARFSSGSGVPTLNRNDVHGELVFVPDSLEEQRVIAQKIDEIAADQSRLKTQFSAKIADFDDLRQSLLQKAFAGELT